MSRSERGPASPTATEPNTYTSAQPSDLHISTALSTSERYSAGTLSGTGATSITPSLFLCSCLSRIWSRIPLSSDSNDRMALQPLRSRSSTYKYRICAVHRQRRLATSRTRLQQLSPTQGQARIHRDSRRLHMGYTAERRPDTNANGWAHNPKVAGSNPAPATKRKSRHTRR